MNWIAARGRLGRCLVNVGSWHKCEVAAQREDFRSEIMTGLMLKLVALLRGAARS
jgi:hypothetical protein